MSGCRTPLNELNKSALNLMITGECSVASLIDSIQVTFSQICNISSNPYNMSLTTL